jgi:hypothetical protein
MNFHILELSELSQSNIFFGFFSRDYHNRQEIYKLNNLQTFLYPPVIAIIVFAKPELRKEGIPISILIPIEIVVFFIEDDVIVL